MERRCNSTDEGERSRAVIAVEQKSRLSKVVSHLDGVRTTNPCQVVGQLIVVQHVTLRPSVVADTAEALTCDIWDAPVAAGAR